MHVLQDMLGFNLRSNLKSSKQSNLHRTLGFELYSDKLGLTPRARDVSLRLACTEQITTAAAQKGFDYSHNYGAFTMVCD